jgi:hypothetical protein
MTYVVVGHKRTGTTYLMNYVYEHFDFKEYNFIAEFFLSRYYLDRNGSWHNLELEIYDEEQINRKFNYFETLKDQNACHPFKIFPYNLIQHGYEERLKELLSDFKILTIHRDPFDSFLSYSYQKRTNWENTHRRLFKIQHIEEFKFTICKSEIDRYINQYKMEKNFINNLDIFHTFEYEDITSKNLSLFFNIEKKKEIYLPMNIDYKKLLTNLEETEEKFRKKLYVECRL